MPAVYYLHGFASSAKSAKAGYLAERLAPYGVTLRRPDFNQPEFRTLTITRMLEQLDRELPRAGQAPAALIGSSLGGALAVLAAERFAARVDRLVLLAPAVMFAKPGHHLITPDRIADWRRLGALPFFHYADNAERLLDYAFYADSLRYNPLEAVFAQPTLIVQGVRDRSVDPGIVRKFAEARPTVRLILVEDEHQLMVSLPGIWEETRAFLGLEAGPPRHRERRDT